MNMGDIMKKKLHFSACLNKMFPNNTNTLPVIIHEIK